MVGFLSVLVVRLVFGNCDQELFEYIHGVWERLSTNSPKKSRKTLNGFQQLTNHNPVLPGVP